MKQMFVKRKSTRESDDVNKKTTFADDTVWSLDYDYGLQIVYR